uniref:Uncharacterized protein n=1 Tax=Anguilla anguilla TaxID=7936 RepID=A0A0E9W9A5_ANGAN
MKRITALLFLLQATVTVVNTGKIFMYSCSLRDVNFNLAYSY